MKALRDVKDAAALLAVSPWTVRACSRAGKLKPIRLGRLVRLDEEEIQRFVARSKTAGDSFSNQIHSGEEQ